MEEDSPGGARRNLCLRAGVVRGGVGRLAGPEDLRGREPGAAEDAARRDRHGHGLAFGAWRPRRLGARRRAEQGLHAEVWELGAAFRRACRDGGGAEGRPHPGGTGPAFRIRGAAGRDGAGGRLPARGRGRLPRGVPAGDADVPRRWASVGGHVGGNEPPRPA